MEKRKTIDDLKCGDKVWHILDSSLLGTIVECRITGLFANQFELTDEKKEYKYNFSNSEKTSRILIAQPVNYGEAYLGRIFVNYIDALLYKRDVIKKLLETQSKVFEETYQAIIKELKNGQ